MISPDHIIAWLVTTAIGGLIAGYKFARAMHPVPPLREHILAALEEGGGTGLDIMRRIERDHGYRPSIGVIYPLLRMMADEGVLECTIVPGGPERLHRQRYVYTLGAA